MIFFSNSKSNNLNDLILKKLNNQISHEIIDLSNILTNEMFEDETHYNKMGHKTIALFISKKLSNILIRINFSNNIIQFLFI